MVIAVKIKNRVTGEFRPKGFCSFWNKTGKSWTSLRNAKLAVCPDFWNCDKCGDFIKKYQKELESDFWIFHDNGVKEIIPVARYFIEKLTKEVEGSYGSERAKRALEDVKQYCKDKNIKVGEING